MTSIRLAALKALLPTIRLPQAPKILPLLIRQPIPTRLFQNRTHERKIIIQKPLSFPCIAHTLTQLRQEILVFASYSTHASGDGLITITCFAAESQYAEEE